MKWFTGVLVYVVLWWLAWFVVLPLKVTIPDRVEPGHATSAPEQPRLGLKAVLATALAAILWLVVNWVIAYDPFGFRPLD